MVSSPAPPLIVAARFGPVIFSFPPAPLIVTVSEPLVKLLAVKFVKDAVVANPTLITKLDIPAAVVSVKLRVFPVNCIPLKVPV